MAPSSPKNALLAGCSQICVEWHYITPGKPMQNGYAESSIFILPASPLVLYLYNPFDAPIVGAVARQAMASWKANPRPIRVVYLNPLFGIEWQNAGWVLLESGEGRAIFAPPCE